MDQFVTLLKNLFDLNKVATVTVPGLALAGALALLFSPPRPIDNVPISIAQDYGTTAEAEQTPCADLPVLGRKPDQRPCIPSSARAARNSSFRSPACILHPFYLEDFDDLKQLYQSRGPITRDVLQAPPLRALLSDIETLAEAQFFVERQVDDNKADPSKTDPAFPSLVNNTLEAIDRRATNGHRLEWDPTIVKQFVLDAAKDKLTECDEVETARKNLEDDDNSKLTADLTNLDKQRSDIQDTYTGYLKSNGVLTEEFRKRLESLQVLIDDDRERFRVNLETIQERARRSTEYKRELAIVTARLDEPGRLRPPKVMDDYITGLLNHVVGFILLSIALSLIANAIARVGFTQYVYHWLFGSF